ncbi:outer membrane protein assembly factor BamA [Oceanospirillum multiglobuliferum]|nr:outer membrane protein assembly factor BamA [Oceanospirillum multiglobuliferum]
MASWIKVIVTAGLLLSSSLKVSMAQAAGLVFEDLRVEGLQRVSATRVFSAFPVQLHQEISQAELVQASKTLFETGLFDDIKLEQDNGLLLVVVKERPSIDSIKITGNDKIKKEELEKGLAQSGLKAGQIFQRVALEQIELELERMYHGLGRYSANIVTEVEPISENRVILKVKINEGEVATIRHINFTGNDRFDNKTLQKRFELEAKQHWSLFNSASQYSRPKLQGDLERLRNWYLDRGYLKFSVDSTQVSISADHLDVFVTINVTEGDAYKVKEIKLSGDLVVDPEEILDKVALTPGETFSRTKLVNSTEAIRKRLGEEGFTFANVNAVPELHDDKTVSITLYVAPGKRTYVRRINFTGNVTTKDAVLRREITQMEAASASTDSIKTSKERLERLGYFKSVQVETPRVAGTDDQIDVNFSVEEQASGSLNASVGFSQNSGVIFGAGVKQNNFLGSGNDVSFSVNKSDTTQKLDISVFDPYYTLDGVSRGISMFYQESNLASSDISGFATDAYGVKVTFGYPITETTRVGATIAADNTRVYTGDDPVAEVLNFISTEGDTHRAYKLGVFITDNKLNRGIMATAGSYQKLSAEVAVPGSDDTFYKVEYKNRYFVPLNDDYSIKLRTDLAYADGYGDNPLLPFYEHYFSGGLGSVRGYRGNSLGPKSTPTGTAEATAFGGNALIETGAELIYPLWFIEDRSSLQTTVFIDAGNVFSTQCASVSTNCTSGIDLSELRMSVGAGLTWLAPIGPLDFSIARALNAKADDDTEFFQFSIGQTF